MTTVEMYPNSDLVTPAGVVAVLVDKDPTVTCRGNVIMTKLREDEVRRAFMEHGLNYDKQGLSLIRVG